MSERKKSWIGQHWKWFLPVGCLGLIAGGALLMLVMYYFIFGELRTHEIYQRALSHAKTLPEITGRVGEPIETGFWVTGVVRESMIDGEVRRYIKVYIPLKGPAGSILILAEAEQRNGVWHYLTYAMIPDGRDAFALTPPPGAGS